MEKVTFCIIVDLNRNISEKTIIETRSIQKIIDDGEQQKVQILKADSKNHISSEINNLINEKLYNEPLLRFFNAISREQFDDLMNQNVDLFNINLEEYYGEELTGLLN